MAGYTYSSCGDDPGDAPYAKENIRRTVLRTIGEAAGPDIASGRVEVKVDLFWQEPAYDRPYENLVLDIRVTAKLAG